MKDTVRILNFARGDLCKQRCDVVAALEDGRMAAYVTDFPSADLIDIDGVIALPHLGASTPESEENCASMGALELIDFLENGNIKNSVNMPAVSSSRCGAARITVIHKNQPNMIATITDTISKKTALTLLTLKIRTAEKSHTALLMQTAIFPKMLLMILKKLTALSE